MPKIVEKNGTNVYTQCPRQVHNEGIIKLDYEYHKTTSQSDTTIIVAGKTRSGAVSPHSFVCDTTNITKHSLLSPKSKSNFSIPRSAATILKEEEEVEDTIEHYLPLQSVAWESEQE